MIVSFAAGVILGYESQNLTGLDWDVKPNLA
jgi:hypothetical protein